MTESRSLTSPSDYAPVPMTEDIFQGTDGQLRWMYEFSLFRNPTVLILIWKIFIFVILGMFLLMLLLQSGSEGFAAAFTGLAPVFAALTGGMLVLAAAAYALYALMMGGKYCVIFEMDEEGVKHTQMNRQFRKAQWLSLLTVMAGAATGSFSTMGAGMLAGSRRSVYSEFRKVKAIQVNRRWSVIKLRTSNMMHNQVYADGADFDFVVDYIQSRIPPGASGKAQSIT
jgi:asparagine N-glycosylation enzyme membrane subunit Stt3